MKSLLQLGGLLLIGLLSNPILASCTQFQHYEQHDLDGFITILENAELSETLRLSAYDKLACADDPVIRSTAVSEGLKDLSASVLRERVFLDSVLSSEVIVVTLIDSPGYNQETRKLVEKHKHEIRLIANNAYPDQGCVSLFKAKKCKRQYLKVEKTKILYQGKTYQGEFELTRSNTVEGYVLKKASAKAQKISAKITLF